MQQNGMEWYSEMKWNGIQCNRMEYNGMDGMRWNRMEYDRIE